jgi:hypothetical protein
MIETDRNEAAVGRRQPLQSTSSSFDGMFPSSEIVWRINGYLVGECAVPLCSVQSHFGIEKIPS